MLSQLPNLLTLLRIAACPVLVLLLSDHAYFAAMILFLAAGITDGLDGYIAKRYNCASSLGAILDPIADKLLVASAYIMLAILEVIPFWLLIVVMFRDLVIVAGYLVLSVMGNQIPMKPTYLSKFNTFLQIFLVIAVLVEKTSWAHIPFIVDVLVLEFLFTTIWAYIPFLVDALVFGVLFTTIGSGSQYVWAWGIRRPPPNSSP